MSVEVPAAKRAREVPKAVPITLLSGFLGSGKTTLLKHILENKEGLKIGVIVNDLAEVNIDKALVSTKASGGYGSVAEDDLVELKNGCACCTVSDELMTSIDNLMRHAQTRDSHWDHIVIEATGVAEPREIRDNFAVAVEKTAYVLHTLVTVIDSSTFLKEFEKRNKVQQRPDLGSDEYAELSSRQVVDLMCEQVEVADVLILNKRDLVGTEAERQLLEATVSSLNPLAKLSWSEHGSVPLASVLAAAANGGLARMDEEAEHRRHVRHLAEHSHAEPSHDEDPSHGETSLAPPPSSHSHGHDDTAHMGATPHYAKFGISSFCYRRRRPFHPHRLMGVIRQLPVRQENLALSEVLSAALSGGGNPQPLSAANQGARETAAPALAVNSGNGAIIAATASEAEGGADGGSTDVGKASPMCTLIRSKGFLWLSNSHSQIFYWALAGKHFELKQYAAWWSCLSRDEWPVGEKEVEDIMGDFDGRYGDHRQELVLIGVQMDQPAITKLLDECLLSDSEMEAYHKHWGKESTPPTLTKSD